jgi:hypothetical protein
MANYWTWEPPSITQRKHSSLQPLGTYHHEEVIEQPNLEEKDVWVPLYCNESMPNPSIASDLQTSSHKKSVKCYQLFPQQQRKAAGNPQRPAGGSHTEYSRKAGSDEENLYKGNPELPPTNDERLSVGSLPAPKRKTNSGRSSEKIPNGRLMSQGVQLDRDGSLSVKLGRGSLDYVSQYDNDLAVSYCEASSGVGTNPQEGIQDIDIERLIANFDKNLLQGFNDAMFEPEAQKQVEERGPSPDNSTTSSNRTHCKQQTNYPPEQKVLVIHESWEPPEELLGELQAFSDELFEKFNSMLQSKRTNAKTHELPAEEWGKAAQDLEQSKKVFPPTELIGLSKRSREDSLKVQSYLKNLTAEELDSYAKIFELHLDTLMVNKFGNYVVQFLLTVHKPTCEAVERLSLLKFTSMVNDEYGSRTMQKACQNNPQYVSKALESFMANFDQLISNIAGSIFLSKLVLSSTSKADHQLPLGPLKQKKDHLQNSYYTRILSTIAGVCEDEVLDQIIELVSDNIWNLMNDKFGNYLILIFFDKQKTKGMNLVKEASLKNSQNLISRKFPKFVLLKLLRATEHETFVQDLATKIISHPIDVLLSYIGRKENIALFVLLIGRLEPKAILNYSRLLYDEISKETTDKTQLAPELSEYLRRLIQLVESTKRSLPCLPPETEGLNLQD